MVGSRSVLCVKKRFYNGHKMNCKTEYESSQLLDNVNENSLFQDI